MIFLLYENDEAAFADVAAKRAKANFMSHTRREPSKIKYGFNYVIEKCGFKKERENLPHFLRASLNEFSLRRRGK